MVSKKTRRYRYTVRPRAPRRLPWNSQAQRPRLRPVAAGLSAYENATRGARSLVPWATARTSGLMIRALPCSCR